MKKLFPTFAAAGVLCAALAFPATSSTGAQEPALVERVAKLEADLLKAREKTVLMEQELAELRSTSAAVVAYLELQGKTAKDVKGSLDASEKAGFTSGINWKSREILLGAFRSYWGTIEQAAPKPEKEERQAAR